GLFFLGCLTDHYVVVAGIGAGRLLYRLFHEEDVRMAEPSALEDRCTCNEQRLTNVMRQFPSSELHDLIEPDGSLHARCQFCGREYLIDPAKVGTA
ncbi:MAG: Hsp33 family molecular chaperone HslO, partial [Caulobacteraceae bacterium]